MQDGVVIVAEGKLCAKMDQNAFDQQKNQKSQDN
jgi:hypothetical protein